MTPRVSVIIPVYGKSSLTEQCLDTLLSQEEATAHEVIVVNDASVDDTAEVLARYCDRIRVITHADNVGFAISCNDGAAAAAGELLLFLNNDTIPRAGWLDALAAYADANPAAAVVGAKMLFPDGTIQHAGVTICQDLVPRHLYAGFPADHPAVNKARQFQIVTAGCALVRRAAFNAANGFDAAFHNGFEDVDLCLRLGRLGHEVHYCPDAVLIHLESVSRELRSPREMRNIALYRERWAPVVRPDDVQFYLEDGLLSFQYDGKYPVRVKISPLAALQDEASRLQPAESLLAQRARQVMALLKENIRLSVQMSESKKADEVQKPAALSAPIAEPVVLARGQFRWLCNEPVDRTVSILIPVKNGEVELRRLLPLLWSQKVREKVEIVAVDSGSTDGSVEVLRDAGATVVRVDPRTFNHGLTRNLLAGHAKGELLVFLVQDAVPADDSWLNNLVAPLIADRTVGAVCSRALPHEDADLLTQRDTLGDLNGSAERSVRQITDGQAYRKLSHHALRVFVNFHNMSSATRAAVFAKHPFRHVQTFGEDVIWAKELLEAGYKVQYEPTSVIRHSHNYSYADLLRRNFDDGIANRQIVGRTMAERDVVAAITHLVRRDWEYLCGEAGLADEELDQWRLTAVLRRTAQMVGQWLGVNHDELPTSLEKLLSITARVRDATPVAANAVGAKRREEVPA